MRSIRTVLVVAALAATSFTGAFGASSDPSDRKAEDAARLEGRAAEVDSKLARMGAPRRTDVAQHIRRNQLRDQRRQLNELIEKLEAGQPVDAAEIDRVLGAGRR